MSEPVNTFPCEYLAEQAFKTLIVGDAAQEVVTSYDKTPKEHTAVSVICERGTEDITPGSGIWALEILVKLEHKMDQDGITPQRIAADVMRLRQVFYHEEGNDAMKDLSERLTATNPTAFFVYGIIQGVNDFGIRAEERLRVQNFRFTVHCMPSPGPA